MLTQVRDVTFRNRGPSAQNAGPASGDSSTGRRAAPQLLDHSYDIGVRGKTELGPQQICMLLGAADRRRPITDRDPRVGQPQHRLRMVGIQLGGAAPPLHRLLLCPSRRREPAKSLSTSLRKAPALVVNPPLEPGRLPEKETVEKRARV